MKPANIFCDAQRQLKIGDFGLATSAQDDMLEVASTSQDFQPERTTAVGTYLYQAPEIHLHLERSDLMQVFGPYFFRPPPPKSCSLECFI